VIPVKRPFPRTSTTISGLNNEISERSISPIFVAFSASFSSSKTYRKEWEKNISKLK
jgi:hypothetical protein